MGLQMGNRGARLKQFLLLLISVFQLFNELRAYREEAVKAAQEEGEGIRGVAGYSIRSWYRAVSDLDGSHKSELSHHSVGCGFCRGVYTGNPRASTLSQTHD